MPITREVCEFFWAVMNNWAGYATGGLIAASAWFYLAWRDKPMARTFALVLSVFFLLMAFFKAWRDKYHKLQTCQNELAIERDRKQPKLSGEIGLVITAPGKETSDSMVSLFAMIKNNGAPSIADNFESRIRLVSSHEFAIRLLSFFPKEALKFAGSNGERTLEVPPAEELRRKAIAQPIPTGGAITGFLIGLVQGVTISEVRDSGTTYFLSFKDSIGNRYEISGSGKEKWNSISLEQLGGHDK